MKTHYIIFSEKFPKHHPRAGEYTNFIKSIKSGKKLHTLRFNYPYWEKRIKEVQAGKAELSIRVWTGKPYQSLQREMMRLTKDDNIGIEKCFFTENLDSCFIELEPMQSFRVDPEKVAKNDGLSPDDFKKWFAQYMPPAKLAIIHLTSFRYNGQNN